MQQERQESAVQKQVREFQFKLSARKRPTTGFEADCVLLHLQLQKCQNQTRCDTDLESVMQKIAKKKNVPKFDQH